MSTKEMVSKAQDRKFTEFDLVAKSILSRKVADALQIKGYFDRLDKAKGDQDV